MNTTTRTPLKTAPGYKYDKNSNDVGLRPIVANIILHHHFLFSASSFGGGDLV